MYVVSMPAGMVALQPVVRFTPQPPGRNCTEGTFRSQEVLQALARADAFLSTWSAMPPEHVPDSADILAPLLGGQVGPGGVVRAAAGAGGAGAAGQGGAGRGGSKGNTPASLGKRGREEVDDDDN